jgi:hypothetical protein
VEVDDHGSNEPRIDPGNDYEYDEAHDVVFGTLNEAPVPRRAGAPPEVQLSAGGDYGYDEAHDFCARRSTGS